MKVPFAYSLLESICDFHTKFPQAPLHRLHSIRLKYRLPISSKGARARLLEPRSLLRAGQQVGVAGTAGET